MKRIFKQIFTTSLVFCLCSQSWAIISLIPNTTTERLYVGAGVGDMFYRVSGDNYLGTGLGWPDDHYSTNSISNQGYGFLAAGFAWGRDDTWLPNYSLGLRYMYIPSTTITGNIDQYSLPQFRNYDFSYDFDILSLLAVAKADIIRWHCLMPYVLVGAGIANFGTSDYTEQALPGVTPRVSPGFGGGSGNNFAYQFGVGIDYELLNNLVINLEYDYLNFGTVSTGKGANYSTLTGTNYDNELLKNDITATTLFLGLTYFVG